MLGKEKYTKLQRIIRNIENNELKKGNFTQIRNPNNRSKSIQDFLEDYSCRLSIIPRPRVKLGNGKRNLQIGSDELVLNLYGDFKRKGFYLDVEKIPYRIVAGVNLPWGILEKYNSNLYEEIILGRVSLDFSKGFYKNAIRKILNTTEMTLDLIKKNTKEKK